MTGRRDDTDPGRRRSEGGRPPKDDEPTLPETTRDDTDRGWGERPADRDLDWYREQRPPHYE